MILIFRNLVGSFENAQRFVVGKLVFKIIPHIMGKRLDASGLLGLRMTSQEYRIILLRNYSRFGLPDAMRSAQAIAQGETKKMFSRFIKLVC